MGHSATERYRMDTDTVTDEELLNLRDEIARLTATALGEDGGLPPTHPIVKTAKRKLVACAKALWGIK